MGRTQQWVSLTLLACLAVVAAGWFLLVSPARADAEDLRSQTEAQRATNVTLAQQLRTLQQRADGLPEQREAIADIAEQLPAGPDTATLLRAVDAAATDAGVSLLAVTPTAVTAFGTVPGAPAPAPAPAPADPAAAPAAPAGPTLGTLPVTLRVAGGFYEIEQFVFALEELGRATRVTDLSVEPGADPLRPSTTDLVEDGRTLVATLSLQAYLVLPPAPTPVPGGTG